MAIAHSQSLRNHGDDYGGMLVFDLSFEFQLFVPKVVREKEKEKNLLQPLMCKVGAQLYALNVYNPSTFKDTTVKPRIHHIYAKKRYVSRFVLSVDENKQTQTTAEKIKENEFGKQRKEFSSRNATATAAAAATIITKKFAKSFCSYMSLWW